MRRYDLLLGLLMVLAGCRLAEREMQDRTPPGQGCANCHTIIAQQWESSAHATAWNDREFVERTRDYSVPNCLPCHASRPLLEQPPHAQPELRDHNRHHGIDCTVCHRLDDAYVGRFRNHIGPHPTVQDMVRLPCSDFCGTCHEAEHRPSFTLRFLQVLRRVKSALVHPRWSRWSLEPRRWRSASYLRLSAPVPATAAALHDGAGGAGRAGSRAHRP